MKNAIAMLAVLVLASTGHGAAMRVHWMQTGCPIVAEWAVLCVPVGEEPHEDLGHIGNTAPTPDACDLTVDLDAGDRAGSWVCWMHAIRIETGEWSPASNTQTVTFGVGATTTTTAPTTTSTTVTTTTVPGPPVCGPEESACERAVAANCLCGGVDPCLKGEWCAGSAKLCPLTQAACRALLLTTTTSSTSTTSSTAPTSTTTSTTLRFEFRAPVVIEMRPL